MSKFVEQLGATLLTKAGEASTAEALSGKGAVALYFSAHWCPPCRGFTPKLAEWYGQSLRVKGLEVVFVSSDKNEDAFKEYFNEMPWLALPYGERELKEKLSVKYKVSGIPTVVILDAEGQIITKDGRAAISGDPAGEDFPWRPKALGEVLAGAKLLGQGGEELGVEALSGRAFALYFSAHWCPPCRGFTPQLAQWYTKDLKAKGLEVVFVSSDKNEDAFKEYYNEMPWLALDYADRKRKEQLSTLLRVSGIPALVIVGADGSVITKEGRGAISGDPTGAEFPWHPKPVRNLAMGPGSINEVPTVVAFCEFCGEAVQRAAEEAMAPLARRLYDEAKAAGEEDPQVAFAIATSSGGLAGKIRGMLSLPTDQALPKLMLLDIPDKGGFYEGPEGDITAETVGKFVADYQIKVLERRQLE